MFVLLSELADLTDEDGCLRVAIMFEKMFEEMFEEMFEKMFEKMFEEMFGKVFRWFLY